jgi:hypothetical protein
MKGQAIPTQCQEGNEPLRAGRLQELEYSSRFPAIWRQECLDRCEPFLGRKPHASLPIAHRPSIHAQLLRQACLSQSQPLSR